MSRLLLPFPPTRGSGCLQLHPTATTAGRWTVSHLHSGKQRLVAHYPASYTDPASGGTGTSTPRFPVAFRPPAFASWASCSRPGTRLPLRSAYRTTRRQARTLTGFPHIRTHETRLEPGAFCTPGTAVSTRPKRCPRPPPAAFSTAVPVSPAPPPAPGVPMTRHQQRFTVIHPIPVFPSPVIPGRNGNPWAFPRASHPAVNPATHARGGDRSWTLTWSYVFGISRTSNRHSHSQRATSRRKEHAVLCTSGLPSTPPTARA